MGCRVLASAAVVLELEAEVRRELAGPLSRADGRHRPGGAARRQGPAEAGAPAWVLLAAGEVAERGEATLRWAEAGTHRRWRLRVARGGPADVSVLALVGSTVCLV